MNATKKCIKCNISKPLERFEGRRNCCRDCRNESRNKRIKELKQEREQDIKDENVTEKTCNECNISKPIERFALRCNYCRDCGNEKRKELRQKKKSSHEEQGILTKTCYKCGITKSIDEFEWRNHCRDCENKRQKDRNAKKKNGIENGVITGNRKCAICCEVKPISEFRYAGTRCYDCETKHRKEYRASEEGKQVAKVWYEKYRDKRNEKRRELRNNEVYRETERYSDELRNIVKGSETDVPYLGCNPNEFRDWLTFCFTDDMTMENHGEMWQIDHVLPYSKFDLSDDEQKEVCFNWKNIMPLPGNDNQVKNKNIDLDQLRIHCDNLRRYHEENDIELPQECLDLLDLEQLFIENGFEMSQKFFISLNQYMRNVSTAGTPLEP
jgi:hypothetical protein